MLAKIQVVPHTISVNNITRSTRPIKATNIEEISQPLKKIEKMQDFKEFKKKTNFLKVTSFCLLQGHVFDMAMMVKCL